MKPEHGDRDTISFADEGYEFRFCDECGIWRLEEEWEDHPGSDECQKDAKHRAVRDAAAASALGAFNRVVR